MCIAVDQHRAGAASALAATEFGRHVADEITQRGQQIAAAIDEDRDIAAVMAELQGSLGHRYSFGPSYSCYASSYSWPVSSRRRWTPTTSRRYQALASESSIGEVPSDAAATAAAMLAASSARPSSARSAAFALTAVPAIAPSAVRAPLTRPPVNGSYAASVKTEPPLALLPANYGY